MNPHDIGFITTAPFSTCMLFASRILHGKTRQFRSTSCCNNGIAILISFVYAEGKTHGLLYCNVNYTETRYKFALCYNGWDIITSELVMFNNSTYQYWPNTLGRRCPSINRWRVRNVRGGLRWPRWRERKYRVGIYFVFFWLKLAVFMVIRQYWKAPILYMLYEILWVVIVVPCTQKNHVLCTQLAILQSYSTTNL